MASIATQHDAIPIDSLKVTTIPLEELGNTLPIGVFLEGDRLNSFKLRPYKTKFDRILGEILSRPKVNLVDALQNFLPQILEEIGGIPIADVASKLSVSVTRLCSGLYLGDALTILLSIRQQAQGTLIKMSAACPACGTLNEDKGTPASPFHDLSGLEIKILEISQKPVFEVRLEDGLTIGSDLIKSILMQPLKLHQFQSLTKQGSSEAYDIAMLYEMVTAIPESEYYRNASGKIFSDELYDELTMRDLEILRDAVDKLQLTPDLTAEMTCRNCGNEWDAALPWGQLRQFLFVAPKPA
ncbi:MAG: hypothetical protein SNJ81_17355 [Cyanobacteriota bacterium]